MYLKPDRRWIDENNCLLTFEFIQGRFMLDSRDVPCFAAYFHSVRFTFRSICPFTPSRRNSVRSWYTSICVCHLFEYVVPSFYPDMPCGTISHYVTDPKPRIQHKNRKKRKFVAPPLWPSSIQHKSYRFPYPNVSAHFTSGHTTTFCSPTIWTETQ